MRFGSIRAFLIFVQMLEGVGYNCQHPLYDIEEGLKRLPDYISKYQAEVLPQDTQLLLLLKRNNEVVWSLALLSPQERK